MNKRGQGIQFNWIFIVIVSAIILLFFAGFVVKYIDLQESKDSAQIARSFANSILSVKGVEQYKDFTVNTPFKLDYDCERIIINDDQKFFIPHSLATTGFDSNELVIWVEDYKKGFLVDRVVFITDKKTKYYFDSAYSGNVPPFIESVSLSEADVAVGVSNNVDGRRDISISGGYITFLDEGVSFPYDDDFFVYLAAFSDANIFNCTKEKLDSKFSSLQEVYDLKIQQISTGSPFYCNYNSIQSAISSGNSVSMIEANNQLANLACEVVF